MFTQTPNSPAVISLASGLAVVTLVATCFRDVGLIDVVCVHHWMALIFYRLDENLVFLVVINRLLHSVIIKT